MSFFACSALRDGLHGRRWVVLMQRLQTEGDPRSKALSNTRMFAAFSSSAFEYRPGGYSVLRHHPCVKCSERTASRSASRMRTILWAQTTVRGTPVSIDTPYSSGSSTIAPRPLSALARVVSPEALLWPQSMSAQCRSISTDCSSCHQVTAHRLVGSVTIHTLLKTHRSLCQQCAPSRCCPERSTPAPPC